MTSRRPDGGGGGLLRELQAPQLIRQLLADIDCPRLPGLRSTETLRGTHAAPNRFERATDMDFSGLQIAVRPLEAMWVFPLLKSLLPVVVAFLLPTTDTLDHRRVGNGTHRHGLFQEPMEELPAMA